MNFIIARFQRSALETRCVITAIEHNSWTRKKIVTFLLILITIMVVLEIWSVNRLANFGSEINKLDRIKVELKIENQLLRNQISSNSSLNETEKYASLLGFEKTKQIDHLGDQGLALNH